MVSSTIDIRTADGVCRTYVSHPDGVGPWPAVIMFMDGIGYRPALFAMADRLADHGYVVVLPDLFYRAGPYVAPDPAMLFTDPTFRTAWFTKFIAVAQQPEIMRDTGAMLDYLATRGDVVQPRVGTTGYCMGGALALAAAGFYPDRVAAAASFHGSHLAAETPTSPHLLASKMTARVYVGGATDDAGFPDAMKQKLDDALTAAGVAHEIETYPARHGWVPSDTPVHDAVCAERHWRAVFALFDETLK